MDSQILYKGIIEYLHWYIDIPRNISTDIASYLDLDNLDSLWSVDLESYIPDSKIQNLRNKLKTHPLKPAAFLLGITFTPNITDIILKHYAASDDLIKQIEENPYSLIDIEEVSFKKIDKVATEILRIPLNSPLRYKALVHYQLQNESFKNGHLFTLLDKFINSKFEVEISRDNLKSFLKELIVEGKIILEGKKLYTKQHYSAEKNSAEIIAKLISNSGRHLFFSGIDVENYITGYEDIQTKNINSGKWKNLKWKDAKFTLSDEQKESIRKFFDENFFIITGLPGTGKTTVTKALVDISINRGLKVTLLAPTGIAAKRLSETCGHEAFTIHKELGFDGVSWKISQDNPLCSDVIIVDEFSMVDQVLLYKILQSLPKKEFVLVFIGDAAQLPSVGPGNVLRELIICDKIPHVALTKIFRQEDTSDIVLNSHQINKGSTQLYNTKKDFIFLDIEHEEEILKNIKNIVNALQGKNYQVLSPTYKGCLGVSNLNRTLQELFNPNFNSNTEFKTEVCTFREGDKVMIIKNDYKNEVYNGESGILVRVNNSNKKLEVLINGKTIEYTFRDAYAMLALDYTRTIHKCISLNSFIPTEKGLLNFKEILEEFSVNIDTTSEFINENFKIKVQGERDIKQTSEIFKKNSINTIKIKTSLGYRLEGTKNHPIRILNSSGDFQWKKLEDIKLGDLAIIKKKFNLINPIIKEITKITNIPYQRKEIVSPRFLNKDIAWMLGYITGDGSYNDKKDHTIEITIFSKEILTRLLGLFKKEFNIEPSYYKYPKKSTYKLYICRKTLREIFFNLGLKFCKAHDKEIPKSIRTSNLEIIGSYISGLFDSDGGVNKQGIHFTTVSEQLALGVSNVLLYFGIVSSFKNLKNNSFRILIQGMDSHTFMKEINFRDPSRLKNWIKYKHHERGYFIPKSNISSIPNGDILISDLKKKLKENLGKTNPYLNKIYGYQYIVNLFNRIISKKTKLTTYHIDLISKYIPDKSIREWKNIEKYQGFLFDPISSLNDSISDVFDFNVPEGHDFVSNGFISHNSQGQEYDYIVMPFVNYFSIQLQRNLLYTAITRAKKKVFIIGHQKALYKAIQNNNVSKRNTILSSRILTRLEEIKG